MQNRFRLRKRVGECPSSISKFVLKALSRSPSERFQTAREMQEKLSEIAGKELLH